MSAVTSTRFRLSPKAECYRKSHFANGRTLTNAERDVLFATLCLMPGCEKYNKDVHDEYCARHARSEIARARGLIAIELEKLWSKGVVLTYRHTAIWAREFEVTFKQADDIVIDLAGERINKEIEDLQAAEAWDTTQQAWLPYPTVESDINEVWALGDHAA
ncbi:hypothetical protein K466DRAFT_277047 [Polyporus arcularius HHB13444]|uniref:Uncharacterized protein n=1 Tax=Polyporus arcularius HHB13444 TaxID=1314778 RepID=A0A5C3P308_9APHY|nr:hypothetical protein K466DRAFT_277047 [Polyporus arcularius HHB13444]